MLESAFSRTAIESGAFGEGDPLHLKIVHRSRLFRESLVAILSQREGVIAEAIDHSADDWLTAIESPPPNVVLIDLALPRRLALKMVQGVHRRNIDAKVVLLVSSHVSRHLPACIELGVHGCVLGDFSLEDLIEAIELAIQGDTFCSQEIIETLSQRLSP